MFDRTKKYFKIFKESDKHNGFQYKDGLNVDTIPFNDNPNKSCVEGGFYFSDAEYICEFLSYGEYIREVEIPDDVKVIKDPDGNKWRSDKLFLNERKNLRKAETWQWMIDQGIDIHADDDEALKSATYNGHFDIVKYLVENNADIHACGDSVLRLATYNFHTEIVHYLESKIKEENMK